MVNTIALWLTLAAALLLLILDHPVVACVFLLGNIAGFCAQIADNTKP